MERQHTSTEVLVVLEKVHFHEVIATRFKAFMRTLLLPARDTNLLLSDWVPEVFFFF